MVRYAVLLKFTTRGVEAIDESPRRAEAFAKLVKQAGGTVASQLWTLGEYDGVMIFEAPSEQTAASLLVKLAKALNVTTQTLRAFDAEEFRGILKQA